jgi:SAM-dependent methyltransferase
MYQQLAAFDRRPEPFSVYTTERLWTDPHIGQQMLAYHLAPDIDAASRKAATIDATVAWLDARFQLAGKHVLDLGCGPGLYASRMATRGASVTGLDFSPVSIAHARAHIPAGAELDYVEGNYLRSLPPRPADLVTLIYGDYCALSPDRRRALLDQVRSVLAPDGRFVFDVYAPAQFVELRESVEFGHRLMDGFWASGDYYGFKRTWLYTEPLISLERYLIVSPDRCFEIFNWMQYFDPSRIAAEIAEAGFTATAFLDIVTGAAWQPGATPFFVVAEARG